MFDLFKWFTKKDSNDYKAENEEAQINLEAALHEHIEASDRAVKQATETSESAIGALKAAQEALASLGRTEKQIKKKEKPI